MIKKTITSNSIKLNNFLDESRETGNLIDELVKASSSSLSDNLMGLFYLKGFLISALMELPQGKRNDMRTMINRKVTKLLTEGK
jgi:hypothetical protein